jgi:hypothetical protein
MTTIDTTTSTTGLAFCNGRHIARTSTGRLWVAFNSGSALEFWYSDDDGASFTQNGSATIAANASAGFSFFIDVDDHAHVAYQQVGSLIYRRMANIGTATSWASAFTVSGTYTQQPDIVAFRDGASWNAVIVATNGSGLYFYVLSAVDSSPTISFLYNVGGDENVYPSIDFGHTGDGKTIAGSAPHIYSSFLTTDRVYYFKLPYSGGRWIGGNLRAFDVVGTKATPVSHAFDGTQSVIAYAEGSAVYVAERDAADTTTTLRTPPALSDGTVTNLSVTYDGAGDIHLWSVGTTSDDVKRIVFYRSEGTWGPWVTEYTGTVVANSLTLKRGYSNAMFDAVFLDGASSPYDVKYASLALNVAPTAPTWQAPADNSAQDIDASLPLAWNSNDPDPGETQSAYVLERQVNGGAAEFYNAGGPSWGAGETVNSSVTEGLTLAADWASDGDSIAYRVKTRDAAGVEGPFSVVRTVVGSTKVEPSLVSPADGGTVTSASVEVTWTATEQTALLVRILTDADVQVSTTGKATSTDRMRTPDVVLENGGSYKAEITTWNDDDLASSTDTHSFDVSYTPPATPVLTVSTSGSAISVAIADPTPVGDQPTVDTHDVFVRVAAGGRQSNERTVAPGDGIRISTATVPTNGTYLDEKAAGSTDFEYRTLAKATNGTATYSAWTG